MKLTIRTRNLLLTPEATVEIRTRLEHAFERIRPWLSSVDLTIADINGPKGGPDKQCRLRVHARKLPSVVVEHVGLDVLATVGRAAERAQQAVLRKLARRRGFTPSFAV